MRLANGNGVYDWPGQITNATVTRTATGWTLAARWVQTNGAGNVIFNLDVRGNFTGTWGRDNNSTGGGSWSGHCVSAAAPTSAPVAAQLALVGPRLFQPGENSQYYQYRYSATSGGFRLTNSATDIRDVQWDFAGVPTALTPGTEFTITRSASPWRPAATSSSPARIPAVQDRA